MSSLQSSIKALVAAAMFALPSQVLAEELRPGNGAYADFVTAVNPAALAGPPVGGVRKPFDNGTQAQLKIIGAKLIVEGISGGDKVVKEIEYTYGKVIDDRAPVFGPRSTDLKPEQQGVGVFFAPLPSPRACTGSGEPILAIGQEYNYHIKWCNNSAPTAPITDSAKKNYYYMYANGDYQLVLTLEFDCDLPSDAALMPPSVLTGAC